MIFQAAAVLILLVFYGCYFTKMLSQKKKGIQTDQMGKGKEGLVKYIEIIMKTATLLVPVTEAASIFLNLSLFPGWVRILGVVLGVLGVAVFLSAVLEMRDSWRAGVSKTERTELVTDGIYQISRNPAFLGFDLVYAGILLMFFNWILLAVTLLAALMLHLQIVNVEEDFLVTVFGDAYLEYRKKVNRYFGRRIVK